MMFRPDRDTPSAPARMTRGRSLAGPHFAVQLACAFALGSCVVGPDYQRPMAEVPSAYKEAAGWAPARPSDAADRSDWWTVFNDPVLDDLEGSVRVSNQNLKAAEAAYNQALALVSLQRAALFPTVALTGSTVASGGSAAGATPYEIGANASWAPDLWGRIHRSIEVAGDSAQASAADLANARLSAQTSLALDYVLLRQLDEDKRIQDAAVAAYARTLNITLNRYHEGLVGRADVASAQSLLSTTQADAIDLARQRAVFEHAIAILTGRPPSELNLVSASWTLLAPDIPAGVPSTLLQRRPDIAGAERLVAAANAQIGVSIAAFYPNITLTGAGSTAAGQLGQLFGAAATFWSLGASVAQTVFDAGARSAQVRQSRAAYQQAVAVYRQTVLTAFGQVEDAMAAQRVLTAEQPHRDAALTAAIQAQKIALNQYAEGAVDYTSVVVAQVAALTARNAAVQNQASRLAASIDMIGALGGGWSVTDLSGLSVSPHAAG